MARVKEEGFSTIARKNDQELTEFRNKNQEMVDKPRIGFGRGLVNFIKSSIVTSLGVAGITIGTGVGLYAKHGRDVEKASEAGAKVGEFLAKGKNHLFVAIPLVASLIAGTVYFNKKDRKHNKENAEANVAAVDAVVQQKITQEEALALREAIASGQAVGQHSEKAVHAKEHGQSNEIAV